MLGMSFLSFLTLTIIGAVVGIIYHWVLHDRFFARLDLAFANLLVGWFGAWLGSPVLGHWLWKYENIYIVPAILGAIAAIHVVYLAVRTFSPVAAAKPEEAAKAKSAGAA